jgi:tRNA(Ile)-lysidine synthase
LREYLTARKIDWIEDPSNHDSRALRARLRATRNDPLGTGNGTLAVGEAARLAGLRRGERDRAIAGILAERVTIRPEGYALLSPGPIDADALASLLRTIAGAPFAPPIDRVAPLARSPGPATLGGVRILPARRLGSGWLLVRERRACTGAVKACPGAVWDGRFRLVGNPLDGFIDGLAMQALDSDAGTVRRRRDPPAAVLHGLPALRQGGKLIAVPHIGFGDPRWRILFDPRNPAAGAPFVFG